MLFDFIVFGIVTGALGVIVVEVQRFFNPITVHKNLKVNWFGAWFIAIICNLIFYIVAIPYWFYKLCTFGRED